MNTRTERYSCFVSNQDIIQYLCKILHDDNQSYKIFAGIGLGGKSSRASNELKILILINLLGYLRHCKSAFSVLISISAPSPYQNPGYHQYDKYSCHDQRPAEWPALPGTSSHPGQTLYCPTSHRPAWIARFVVLLP